MKARIPKHREFIIDFPQDMDQAKADEGWNKLNEIVEEYKKAHNGQSVYSATFIEDCEPAVKKLQEVYRLQVHDPGNQVICTGRTTASAGFWFTRM